jgi:hypothetical protein
MNFFRISKKKIFLGSLMLLLIGGSLVLGDRAFAANEISNFFLGIVEWFAMLIIDIMGSLLLLVIDLLIKISQFGDFLNTPIVDKGWVVIRDICYVVIIILLLFMAFATAFGKKDYQIVTMLPKLFFAAIMIHFSKMVSGLIIDFSQVVMMFFVNQFKDIAAGNIVYGFGIHDMMAFRETATQAGIDVDGVGQDSSILGGMILAVLMITVATIVVFSLVIMFLARIFILWILVMLSPLAFMGAVMPSGMQGQGGFSFQDWWKNIWKWTLTGPAIAFMLWLTLAITNEMTAEKRIMNLNFQSQTNQGNTQNSTEWSAFANQISSTQNVTDYLVTTALFMATLFMASKTGIAGASVAQKGFDKIKNTGEKMVKNAPKNTWGASKWFGTNTAGRFAAATMPGSVLGGMAQDSLDRRRIAKEKKTLGMLRKVGMGDNALEALGRKTGHSQEKKIDKQVQKQMNRMKKGVKDPSSQYYGKTDEELKKIAESRVTGGYIVNPAILLNKAASTYKKQKTVESRQKKIRAETERLKKEDNSLNDEQAHDKAIATHLSSSDSEAEEILKKIQGKRKKGDHESKSASEWEDHVIAWHGEYKKSSRAGSGEQEEEKANDTGGEKKEKEPIINTATNADVDAARKDAEKGGTKTHI